MSEYPEAPEPEVEAAPEPEPAPEQADTKPPPKKRPAARKSSKPAAKGHVVAEGKSLSLGGRVYTAGDEVRASAIGGDDLLNELVSRGAVVAK